MGGTFTQDIFYSFKGYSHLLVLDVVHCGGKPGTLYRLTEDALITDYVKIAGVSAALVNSALVTLVSLLLLYLSKEPPNGFTLVELGLMAGFSLFGKNIVNIWPIIAGTFLYAKARREPFGKYVSVSLLATALAPVVSYVALDNGFGNLWWGIAVGLLIGFVLPPLATHVHYAHKGYSLYNVGFASGIIATVVVSVMKSFGVTTESRLIWSTGNNRLFLFVLCGLFLSMMGGALVLGGKEVFAAYGRILKTTGISGTDYLKSEGGPATTFNMGLCGLFATLFVAAVGGDLNGPTIGGIFTIVGFCSTGKHLRNIAPIMFGVVLGGFTKHWHVNQPSPLLALLFSTTLAPVAGEFGWIVGILAGFLHSSVALNVGIVYGGMNLYNNGFAGGIVAIFMVPVIHSIEDRRARARGEISL